MSKKLLALALLLALPLTAHATAPTKLRRKVADAMRDGAKNGNPEILAGAKGIDGRKVTITKVVRERSPALASPYRIEFTMKDVVVGGKKMTIGGKIVKHKSEKKFGLAWVDPEPARR